MIAARKTLFLALLFLFQGSHITYAGSFIRDTETEQTIRFFADEIISVAGLLPTSVKIKILLDPEINAFVSGGQRITITTGLIKATETPGQLMGVIAHEVAHIAGGHLARLNNALSRARTTAQATQFLAAALGAISRHAPLANAVGPGGSHIAERNLLKFSRNQEQSADLAATQYLDAVKVSSRGMLQFLEKLKNLSLLEESKTTQYENTHPLIRDRISFVKNHLNQSRHRDRTSPPVAILLHAKLVAKVSAFTNPPSVTLARYSETSDQITTKYARAIAFFKYGEIKKSLSLINKLIKDKPKNPFFYELKGQILFENGRVLEAKDSYQRALGLLPKAPLIMVSLAHTMLELKDTKLHGTIKELLTGAIQKDPKNQMAWHLLGTA